MKTQKMFSGPKSKPFWGAITKIKDKKTRDILFKYGCLAQEQESYLIGIQESFNNLVIAWNKLKPMTRVKGILFLRMFLDGLVGKKNDL